MPDGRVRLGQHPADYATTTQHQPMHVHYAVVNDIVRNVEHCPCGATRSFYDPKGEWRHASIPRN